MIDSVFLVGSWTGGRREYFIVDQVHLDEGAAIDYCESRRNAEYDWSVLEFPFRGGRCDWIDSEVKHTTRRER